VSRQEVRVALEVLAEEYRHDSLGAGYYTDFGPFRDAAEADRVRLELEDAAEKYLRAAGFSPSVVSQAAENYAAEEVQSWRDAAGFAVYHVDKNPR
jgi:hypothetical protein